MATVTEEQAGKKAYVSLWCFSPLARLGETLSGDGGDRPSQVTFLCWPEARQALPSQNWGT